MRNQDMTTSSYPASVRASAVQRYLNSDLSYVAVAAEIGCSDNAVRSWVLNAAGAAKRAGGGVPQMKRQPDDRSGPEKLDLLLRAAGLTDEDLGAFLRTEGLRDGDLERWREEAAQGLGRGTRKRSSARRIKELERQNRQQGKRLREAAALLSLQKKVNELWAAEDDDTL